MSYEKEDTCHMRRRIHNKVLTNSCEMLSILS
jgi:hypothetical protein